MNVSLKHALTFLVSLPPGDTSRHGSSNGPQNEPATIKPPQHVKRGPTHEQAQSSQHFKVHGCLRARGSIARPHRIHQ